MKEIVLQLQYELEVACDAKIRASSLLGNLPLRLGGHCWPSSRGAPFSCGVLWPVLGTLAEDELELALEL